MSNAPDRIFIDFPGMPREWHEELGDVEYIRKDAFPVEEIQRFTSTPASARNHVYSDREYADRAYSLLCRVRALLEVEDE